MSLFLSIMSWRIIYIEDSDYLSLYLDNLKVRKGNDETTIPLSDINSIVINNISTTMTVRLINRCMEYKINLVTCDLEHMPCSILMPYNGHYMASSQLFKQINWTKESLEVAWVYFVKAKITNQIRVLTLEHKNQAIIDTLLKYIDNIQLNDSTNREGLAAKVYFRELFGPQFKRFNQDSINAALNFGYSILRSQIARSLVAKGLNPQIGIFHRGPGNAFNLADDFIECFRPIIDRWVHQNIEINKLFNRENRLELIALTTKRVIFNNNKITVINAINLLIDNFLKFVESGEMDALTFPDIKIYDVI